MTNTIDQHTRSKLGISSVHYLVMDVCAQYSNLMRKTSVRDIAMDLGLTERAVSTAMNDLCKTEPKLLDIHESGNLYPTKHWYQALIGENVTVTNAHTEMAKGIIEYFNQINDARYQIPNNAEMVKSILKSYPRLTTEHFKSVILHKRETWGRDEKMSTYNRPSTLFANSQKFMRYLDDATNYWTNKAKLDEYARTNR